VLGSIL